jgi:hypothetical protein
LAKISTYVIDGSIVDDDKVIGSDANNDMVTKNYKVGDLISYFAVSIGNNYLVPYIGANDDVDLGSFNLLASSVQISDNIIAGGTVGTVGQVLMSQGPGLPSVWAFNAGSQGLNSVLNNGNTSTRNIQLVNGFGSAIIDIENVYGNAAIYLSDITNSFNSYWKPNTIHIEDASWYTDLNTNKIRFGFGGNYVDLIPTNYTNQTMRFPTNGGVIPVSVNGVFAGSSGDITLPTSGGSVTSVQLASGTGIGLSGTNPITTSGTITITNTAPDQVVALTGGTGISTSGAYPNFTITNTAPDQTVSLTSGTGISITGTYPNFTIAATGGSGVTSVTATTPLFSSGGSTPNITIQQASGSQDGYLSSTDWTTFNNKQPAGTYVTGVAAIGPITSTGGTTPTISTSMNTNKLIGRSTAGTGVMEEITIGSGLSLSSGTLSSTVSGVIPKGTASGTDTYTTTISGVSSYVDGDAYLIRFTNGNTTGCTLNINGLGARTLYRNNDGALIGGDIISGGEMICVYNSTLVGFQVIGTAPNTLLGYVTNADSVTITKGQVVYAFGGQGDRMTVKLASNTADATSARTVGVVLSTSIAVNQKGLIMMQGLLDGLSILPTATYSDGDPIYLGATAGSITNVKPYAPNHLVYVATVTTASNGSSGRMYVNIQNGYELDELHNVQAQSPALKDTLWYDSGVTPGQWKTASISTILGYTPVGGTGTTNELAYFTGSTTLGSLTTATYPSLTEISYVKGVTSSIQTQLGTKGYVITAFAGSLTPANNTTYYFGNQQRIPTTTAAIWRLFIPRSGTIKRADFVSVASTVGTAENISLSIRLNNTTDTLVATVGNTSQPRLFQNSSLSIAVVAGDYIEMKLVTPTWVTQPTGFTISGQIYIE